MSALNPAAPFNYGARKHSRFAQHLQRDAGAHDIDDRIYSSDFVKMNLFGRHTVNFPFRQGDALKHRLGFLLYPIRKPAVADELFYLREITAMFMIVRLRFVVMVPFIVFMVMVMLMFMRVMGMAVGMASCLMSVNMPVGMFMFQVNLEFHPFDTRLFRPGDVEVVPFEP